MGMVTDDDQQPYLARASTLTPRGDGARTSCGLFGWRGSLAGKTGIGWRKLTSDSASGKVHLGVGAKAERELSYLTCEITEDASIRSSPSPTRGQSKNLTQDSAQTRPKTGPLSGVTQPTASKTWSLEPLSGRTQESRSPSD